MQRRRRRDVVHQEEGVRAEVRGREEAAVFFLARRVGQGEVVGRAVDGAGDGVGVLWVLGRVGVSFGAEGVRGASMMARVGRYLLWDRIWVGKRLVSGLGCWGLGGGGREDLLVCPLASYKP